MEGLGEYLKHGRKEAGLSLEDLAGRTRIRLENLERLEEGDLAGLPTETYVRGFVRLVCKELGLPADEGISRYEMLLRSRAPTDEMVWSAEQDTVETSRLEHALRDPERIVGIAKRAGIAVAAIVVVVLVITGGRFLAGLVSDRRGDDVAQSDVPAESAEAGSVGVDAVDAVDAGETVAAAAQDASAAAEPAPAGESVPAEEIAQAEPAPTRQEPAAEPPPAEPKPLQLALAQVELSPRQPGIQPGSAPPDPAGETDLVQAAEDTGPRETSETPPPARRAREPEPEPEPAKPEAAKSEATKQEQTRAEAVEPKPVEAPSDVAVVESAAPAASAPREILGTRIGGARLELEVEALRDVEFAVLLDGVGRPRTRSMQAGERRIWKAQSLFVITADDGGAIRLRLSGEDLGLAGADGEPVRGLRVRAP